MSYPRGYGPPGFALVDTVDLRALDEALTPRPITPAPLAPEAPPCAFCRGLCEGECGGPAKGEEARSG